jgi:hypothetical protein
MTKLSICYFTGEFLGFFQNATNAARFLILKLVMARIHDFWILPNPDIKRHTKDSASWNLPNPNNAKILYKFFNDAIFVGE